MLVKRLGPSLVPAEVVVPVSGLAGTMDEIESKVHHPVLKEGIIVRSGAGGRPEAVHTLEVMVDIAKKRLAAGEYPAPEEKARCGWLYVGYYTDFGGLFNWMEEQGYTYLFDVLDLFFPEPIPTGSKSEMLEGICKAARTFPMTKQMGATSMSVAWIDDAVQLAREMGANCAIFAGHHACKQTWSVISIVQKELMERAGAPT